MANELAMRAIPDLVLNIRPESISLPVMLLSFSLPKARLSGGQ
jgi:hypothetical protein